MLCAYCKHEFDGEPEFCPRCGWFLKQTPPSSDQIISDEEIKESRIFLSLSSHEKYRIEKIRTTLGREMGDISIRDDLELSRLHCEFIYKDHKLHVRDLNSHNGVFIEDRRIPTDELIPLQPGDRIKIGSNVFTLEFKSDTGTGDETGPIFYLKAQDDNKEFQLRLGENMVGRGEFCHVRIQEAPYVAHEHAIVELSENMKQLGKIDVKIQDKGSKNGTTINGIIIPPYKWRDIEVGDEVVFADKAFTLITKNRKI
jgi:pSer/pThr/pTyr-binding forkhead associated (FHA) protein